MNRIFGCKPNKDRIGILLAQLGTPDAPTKKALRVYLKQFLSDKRVIELNPVLWWIILNFIILNTRPKKSAQAYARIWTDRGSPLLSTTIDQTQKLQEKFNKVAPNVLVDYGMRYGNPSLESAIDRLIEQGCSKILLFPMYPQYAAATSASAYDAVFPHLLKKRWVPTLRVADAYFKHPEYLGALAKTINQGIKNLDFVPERLVLSFHGVPLRYVANGDPYCCMCTETSQSVIKQLDFPRENILQTFQSRFGKEPWLTPYTDETIIKLAESGVKKIAVACPGFTTDCLETIDEIGNENAHLFKEHGGEVLKLIPSLNAQDVWMEALLKITKEEIDTWLEREVSVAMNCAVQCPSKLVC